MPVPMGLSETAALTKVLLQNATIPAHGEKRLMPGLEVKKYDRLHIHVGRDAMSVGGLTVRVLFITPIPGLHCGGILADSTVWFEESVNEREFIWTGAQGRTGFIVSVPVVAPFLFDVILSNTTDQAMDAVYVTLLAQEI